MAKEKIKEQRYHNGLAIDSDEEYATLLWLEELMQRNIIKAIVRADSFELSDGLTNVYEEKVQLKTKEKRTEKRKTVLGYHVYTPEFLVSLTVIGGSLLVDSLEHKYQYKFNRLFLSAGTTYMYLEVKPEWDQNNMERLFKINQKWVWEKYGEYVNLVKPYQLMEKTFTPVAFLTTPTGKKRTIHWEVRTLDQWLESLNDNSDAKNK